MPRRKRPQPHLLVSSRDPRFLQSCRDWLERPFDGPGGPVGPLRLTRVRTAEPIPELSSIDGVLAELDGASGLARLQEIRALSERLPPMPWLIVAPLFGTALRHLDWALPATRHRGRLLVLQPASPAELQSAAASVVSLARAEPNQLRVVGGDPAPSGEPPRSLQAELKHLEDYLRELPERLAGPGDPAPSAG